MDLIYQWCQNNLDVIFFVYGLAFLMMGLSILIQPRKNSEFQLAGIIWLLGVFGITHGLNEFLDMWAIIKGGGPVFDKFRWFFLVTSFFFLFEYGRQLLRLTGPKCPECQKRIIKPLVWWLSPVIVSLILVIALVSLDFWKTGSIFARYLLGFPGGILISFGFISYYKCEEKILEPVKVKKYFYLAGLAFLIYGILGGLIVPKSDFFPANRFNNDSFSAFAHIPVQLFRAICAIIVFWSMNRILNIFNWESTVKLKKAQAGLEEELKESEKKYEDIIENSTDIISSVNKDGFVVFVNKKATEILGYSNSELIGKHVGEIYSFETWDDMKKGFEKLKKEGLLFVDNGKMIKKNGEELDVTINSSAIYDSKGNFVRTRTIIKDITERRRAEEELRESYEKLRRALAGTAASLASALEKRDQYTAGHQNRVSQLACAIAKEMGMTDEQIEGVRIAGILHDIGKLNIPAEILSKPGKLSDLEFAFIKTHAQSSYDILKDIEFPWPIAKMVLQHHERINGSGYPQGLSGENILPEAKILAVADVVEAMASHRPYRAALGIDKALLEITQNKGTIYDPNTVDACLKVFRDKIFKFN